ncbi:histidine--tRNA ligase [Alicyclobacillus fastidiosus]|uniref:Histidine--tRNA ligase n=1 Tax=Alicyclobacillus fastidiosus TaxID=392011 RepID=A0ABV5ACR5_9BACL|nr:histidine--tRNA ligase [Alicyclobacillus fastidiosus]WEH11297.1 histidine--tRNA ligase [Alicyclobacillus fastidiosus]
MDIQRPRGTADLLPGTVEAWQVLERIVRETLATANYQEIRTPVFEYTELFERGVGDTTDIVSKEMYTFEDRGGRSVTLRPEGTAGVVRAFVENKLYGQGTISKLYYIEPMFRYEKPQKGRFRQFHQYGVEVLGSEAPAIDAEVIQLNLSVLQNLGLKQLTVELNSVGCAVCRPRHKETMIALLSPRRDELCKECQERLEKNPLRMFDCKNEHCHTILREVGAPYISDALCDECSEHFQAVQGYLTAMSVPFVHKKDLVRGLDYYTRTAWEITSPGFTTIAGGGRYNGLVEQVGGPATPGIGFGGGIERALWVLGEQGGRLTDEHELDAFVAVADESAERPAMVVLSTLRGRGISCDRDYQGRGLKSQFKLADRANAKFVIILGESELASGKATVKDLATGQQDQVVFADVATFVQERLGEAPTAGGQGA